MTNEEKQLLYKDLCGRLPYEVKVNYVFDDGSSCPFILSTKILNETIEKGFKPYLRPLSSMTEEEKYEINEFLGYRKEINVLGDIHCAGWNGDVFVDIDKVYGYLNWLNEHHFDYRGLIKKGLAIEAPEEMYKNK